MTYIITKETLKIGLFGFLAGMLAEISVILILLSFPLTRQFTLNLFLDLPNIVRYVSGTIYLLLGLCMLIFAIGTFKQENKSMNI